MNGIMVFKVIKKDTSGRAASSEFWGTRGRHQEGALALVRLNVPGFHCTSWMGGISADTPPPPPPPPSPPAPATPPPPTSPSGVRTPGLEVGTNPCS